MGPGRYSRRLHSALGTTCAGPLQPDPQSGTVWDRTVCAFELKDEATVARAVRKFFINDAKSDDRKG